MVCVPTFSVCYFIFLNLLLLFYLGALDNKPLVTSVNGNGHLKRKVCSASSGSDEEKSSQKISGNGTAKIIDQVSFVESL